MCNIQVFSGASRYIYTASLKASSTKDGIGQRTPSIMHRQFGDGVPAIRGTLTAAHTKRTDNPKPEPEPELATERQSIGQTKVHVEPVLGMSTRDGGFRHRFIPGLQKVAWLARIVRKAAHRRLILLVRRSSINRRPRRVLRQHLR